MHVQGLLEDNLPIPESESFAEYVAIAEKSSTSLKLYKFFITSNLFSIQFKYIFPAGGLLKSSLNTFVKIKSRKVEFKNFSLLFCSPC